MLKCLRQLADSGWFGCNWNTGDWERLRETCLSIVNGIFMNMLPRLIVFIQVLRCLPERICFLSSISYLISQQRLRMNLFIYVVSLNVRYTRSLRGWEFVSVCVLVCRSVCCCEHVNFSKGLLLCHSCTVYYCRSPLAFHTLSRHKLGFDLVYFYILFQICWKCWTL